MKLISLTLLIVFLLVGCNTTGTLPSVQVIHTSNTTLEDICRSLEEFTTKVGKGKISKNERKHRRQLEQQLEIVQIHEIIREDMAQVMTTVYALPMEDENDVVAFANLVYENCIVQNKL